MNLHSLSRQGQGSPPYTINILPTNGNYSNLLETLPVQHSAGIFHWTVDFQPGANIVSPCHCINRERERLLLMPNALRMSTPADFCLDGCERSKRLFRF